MHEMIILGRGGQGVLLASQMLAEALMRAGYWAQTFPEFKAERRGAPISAFLRWDTSRIFRRYRVERCDILLAFAASSLTPETLALVKPGGLVIVNRPTRFPHYGPFRIARVPGSSIARDRDIFSAEGRPMHNTAMLGACMRCILPEALPALETTIAARMGGSAAINIKAAKDGYAMCVLQRRQRDDKPVPAPIHEAAHRTPLAPFSVSLTLSLKNITGSWKDERPEFTALCTACALCALVCPEGIITRKDGRMIFDDDYCKGCGICVQECPVKGAIEMKEVTQ